MAEEDSKPLNYIPEVILKKRKSNEAWALRKKAQFERSNFQSNKNKESIKKPEDFVLEYRNMVTLSFTISTPQFVNQFQPYYDP